MNAPVVLIHERDGDLGREIKKHLIPLGLNLKTARDGPECIQCIKSRPPSLVMVCAHTKDAQDEIRTISKIRHHDGQIPIFFLTRHSSESLAIRALQTGVNDFFKSPFSYKKLLISIKKNLTGNLKPAPSKCNLSCRSTKGPVLVGDSEQMQKTKAHLVKVAKADSTVLITGETGTGKDLAANIIHNNSPRSKKPLVCINCAAVPDSLVESELFGYERGAFTGAVATKKGLFEAAAGGTIFLDEIGDMSAFAQAKILRTIEMKETSRLGGNGGKRIDFRVIAASNQEPETLIEENKFRKDLYYRLNVARVHMPPLRDRKEDIPLLIDYYLEAFNQRFGRQVKGFKQSAMDNIFLYDWPGNVRELKNLMEVSFINLPSRKVDYIVLPKQLRNKITELKALPKSERDRIISTLCATNWNKSKAARKLNWSRMTLYRKIAKYNLVGKINNKNEKV